MKRLTPPRVRRVISTRLERPRLIAFARYVVFFAVLAIPFTAFAQFRFELVEGFDNSSDVAGPIQIIQASDGSFYGTRGNEAFKIDATGTRTTLHRFRGPDGQSPNGVIQGRDGDFYGTTATGGAAGALPAYGTVFRMDAAGNVTVLHRFIGPDGATPVAALVEAADGSFYGTTAFGGGSFVDGSKPGNGTVFKIDASGRFTSIHSFTGVCTFTTGCALTGANPRTELIQARDGDFYGTANADNFGLGGPTVFRMSSAGVVTTLVNFARAKPAGPLLQASDGRIYGTAISTDGGSNGLTGSVFVLGGGVGGHGFSDGTIPTGRLVQGPDGAVYGTAVSNGYDPAIRGALFKIDPAGTFTSLHRFSGPDGANPPSGLTLGTDGRLYGTTPTGGPDFSSSNRGFGTVFAVDTAGMFTTIHAFAATASAGSWPADGLTEAADGSIYGTTLDGGLGNGGIYRIDADGLATLYQFPISNPGGDGSTPEGRLLQADDGRLYGVTSNFGAFGNGTAFAIDRDGALTTLHHFTADEGTPRVGLIQGADGDLYGSTGKNIFRMTTAGAVTVLHSFVTERSLLAGVRQLVQGPSGSFYGVTTSDGPYGYGTVFTMDPAGTVTTLHDFTGSDGGAAMGPLIQATDGFLYGTTFRGGASFGNIVEPAGYGTVFRIDAAGNFTTVHSFGGLDGANPFGGLVQASDGALYGTTTAGGFGDGTIFRVDPSGNLTTVHRFVGADGSAPTGELIEARDGRIYGVAQFDGPGDGGVIFRLVPTRRGDGIPITIPGSIEAEDYDGGGPGIGYADTTPGNEGGGYRADDVDIKSSREGGYAVGWFEAGEWLAYTIDVQREGLYTISARVGSALPDRTFHIEIDGADVTGPIAVPQLADWDQYATLRLPPVALAAGRQQLRIVMGPDSYMDLQGLEVVLTPLRAVPGIIEAEDYDPGGQGAGYFDTTPGNDGGDYRADDVDIKASREGGYAVGWMSAGEWLAYTVDVQSEGTYTIMARVGSALPRRTFHIDVDGRDLTGAIAVPVVVDWDLYGTVTIKGMRLSAGPHVLRVVVGAEDYMDFQGFAIVAQSPVP
jgi:uncharacterized repeat protein (TIGR03803 family)